MIYQHKDQICTNNISGNNRKCSTTTLIPKKSSNTSNDKNDSYFDHQSRIYFNSRIPPPSKSNLLACDSPVASPYRRSRADQDDEDEDDDFKMVTNKRRRKIDKNNSIEYEYHDELSENNQCIDNHHEQYSPCVIEASLAHPTTKSHQNGRDYKVDKQAPIITNEATQYAKTRFPFAPFIIRFSSGNLNEKMLANELLRHWKNNLQSDINITNIRRSLVKCPENSYDFLIYVKDTHSFCSLFNKQQWPQIINGQTYSLISTPPIPPQLSIIIRNVPLQLNIDDLCTDVRITYADIHNAIRLKNKYQNDIKLVKVELLSPSTRDELLKNGKLVVNGITYDLEEYLAPASVLICSKCMAIGHFRKQCKEINETCRICGTACLDLRQHNCSRISKCIHCNGDHYSNALKCPIVKNFRSALTKQLLSAKVASALSIRSESISSTYQYDPSNFPPLPHPQHWQLNSANNSMTTKIDELMKNMVKINSTLDKLVKINDKYEQFMQDKTTHDAIMAKKLDELTTNFSDVRIGVAQHECKLTRLDNIFTKLLVPMLDEIGSFLSNINIKHGGTLDADFKVRINRMRTQMNNAQLNKDF